jgi:hypothetical protein
MAREASSFFAAYVDKVATKKMLPSVLRPGSPPRFYIYGVPFSEDGGLPLCPFAAKFFGAIPG